MPDRIAGACAEMQVEEILKWLESVGSQENREGMSKFGINASRALGVSMPSLRAKAKEIGTDHGLADGLWASSLHEARILACLVDDPRQVTGSQMERWVKDFDSWDLCDQCCSNLFSRTTAAYGKAEDWSGRDEEFVKRAGFVLMATLAVHDKKAKDEKFLHFLPLIMRESDDERNFVMKAVNWSLRQIGKRNGRLNEAAIAVAMEIRSKDSRSARWIASDALRELTGDEVLRRIRRRT
jgi:3-methyladenine DNA glycosylase AlkD